MTIDRFCSCLDSVNWDLTRKYVLYGGIAGSAVAFLSDVASNATLKNKLANAVDACCEVFSETITPTCQTAVDNLFGVGFTILNATLACTNDLRPAKSSATTDLVISIIGGISMTAVAGCIIGKMVYDYRKGSQYVQLNEASQAPRDKI